LIPSVLAGIFAVLFLAFFIAVIVMASSSSTASHASSSSSVVPPPVHSSSSSDAPLPVYSSSSSDVPPSSFDEYSADIGILVRVANDAHVVLENKQKLRVFGPEVFSEETVDKNGVVMARDYQTSHVETTRCFQIGTHGNCYKMTGGESKSFSLSEAQLLTNELMPCIELCEELVPTYSSILLSKRNLDKCKIYGEYHVDGSSNTYVVESENGYPVLTIEKDFKEHLETDTFYLSFDPKKPTDESSLQPFPGVTVYDLRNGEGDCGGETFSKRTDGAFDKYMEQIGRNQKLDFLLMSSFSNINSSRIRNTVLRDPSTIPAEFDARTNPDWSECADIIGIIPDQDPCGSCWAMSSSSVLSDRLCIATNEKEQLSPQYMVYCGEHTFGCQGSSSPVVTWEQLVEQGTVSEDCIPFVGHDGRCPDECKDGTPITDFMLVQAEGIVYPWGETSELRVQAIQSEILENGPVTASLVTFSDFNQYKGGVYHRSKDAVRRGGHAVRIIGWGTTDEGEDYWLVANSWADRWGEDGCFRIRRGNNECNIEEQVAAGVFL